MGSMSSCKEFPLRARQVFQVPALRAWKLEEVRRAPGVHGMKTTAIVEIGILVRGRCRPMWKIRTSGVGQRLFQFSSDQWQATLSSIKG